MIAIQSGADLTGVKEGALKFWQQAARAQWYEVAGSSMWPFLLSGDSVLIQPNVERLQIGDVALLRCG